MELSEKDNIEIAFCHNDLGNYATTPKLKEFAQKWAAKNIVSGGYIGSYGDIVVDDYNNPKEIIGICNGTGDFKITHSLEDKKRIDKLRKIIDD